MTASLPLVGLLIVSSACGFDYGVHEKPEEVEPGLSEDAFDDLCEELCTDQIADLAEGCWEADCGVGVGGSASADQVVDTVAVNGGNGVCELVIDCPGGDCYDEYFDCIEENGSLGLCESVYSDCEAAARCGAERQGCDDEALAEYYACTGDTCWDDYEVAWLICECEEEVCLTGDERFCEEEFGAPPPVPLAPRRFSVSRRFIDQILLRSEMLGLTNRTWAAFESDGSDRGIRVARLDAEGPLAKLGVRDGDLVVAVNGTPVLELVRDTPSLLGLRNKATIRVRVRRAGQSIQLRYDLVP